MYKEKAMTKIIPFVLFILLSTTAIVYPCMWDRDTIYMEKSKFPEVIELITGKFRRHSKAFYKWRIEDRLDKLKGQEKEQWYDDLAVSYEKTGQLDKAIELALKRLDKNPKRYENLANLGTFYIHKKEYKKGIEYIGKAIEVNPDAHFGREIYQKYLVEFMLYIKQKHGAVSFPLKEKFDEYLMDRLNKNNFLPENERKKAIKGVLGMMRFGNFDSPVLLEALAHLLSPFYQGGETQLAARALLKASYKFEYDKKIRNMYRKDIDRILSLQVINGVEEDRDKKFEIIEKELNQELEEGRAYFEEIVEDEQRWIETSSDPEEEFRKKYYK